MEVLKHYWMLAAIAAVWLVGVVGIATASALIPKPDGPAVTVVHWTNGHLLRDGSGLRLLRQMAEEFNDADHTTADGTRIKVEVHYAGSADQAADLLSRATSGVALKGERPDPTLVTPSAAHWLVPVNHEFGGTLVEIADAPSIAQALIGIVTYREMAECLGWPEEPVGYADIIELRNDPDGWAAYPCAQPEWGKRPLVAYTDPTTSSTGRSVLLSLYAIAAAKDPRDLTLDDIADAEVQSYVREFQTLVDHYAIGTIPLNTRIYQGPRYGHFFIMPEDNLVHLYEGTEEAIINGVEVQAPPITESMVMMYPTEGTMARNNCACAVQAPWVEPLEREGADQWVRYLLEDEQQRSFMAAGFRPSTGVPLGDPISGRFGLTAAPDVPVHHPDQIDPAVAAAIDADWEHIKRPGIVTFVVDTSGSMQGEKLQQAKEGLLAVLGSMASTNQIGLITFNDEVVPLVPTGPLETTRFEVATAVEGLSAQGGTALYDAIAAAVRQSDSARGPADAIRGVVVLTDGQANQGRTRLDDIVQLASRAELTVSMSGYVDQYATNSRGERVDLSEVSASALALPTEYPVQIFFIGIGGDADLEIGRLLSQGTGADFAGVTESDIASAVEEFSRYF